MNQQGLAKNGKAVNFISLHVTSPPATVDESCQQISAWETQRIGLVSIITGAEELARLSALHREATELICGADRSHLCSFIEGYEAGFTVSFNTPSSLVFFLRETDSELC